MDNPTIHLHTIKIGQRVNITATQKYVIMEDGEPCYMRDYSYAVFDHQHLISTGSISGSNMDKLTEEMVQSTFDSILEHKRKYGN